MASRIIQKDNFHILITSGVGPVVWVVNLAALGMLLFQMRGRTVIQLWLTVALLASLLDVTLTLFSGSRYSLGWYAARLNSILSATFVLGTLLYEIRRLYYRIVRQERIFRTVFEFAAVGIARIDLTRRPIEVNRAMEIILGYPEEDLCRMNAADLTHPEDLTKEQELLQELKEGTRDHFQVEKRYFHKNGGLVWGNSIVSVVRGVNDEPEFFIGMVEDITRRKEYEKQITYQAFHDALTGLPNRALFSDRLQLALIQAKRTSRKLGVLFLDLDGFKAVNDEHGHEAGDQLLQEVADRLAGTVRSGDTVARLGGDEFIVLLPDIAERMDAETVAEKIREQVSAPFALEGSMAYVSTSIGMALYPYHGDEAQDLIKHADLAMYRAKQLGKNRWCFFEGKQTSLGG
ncbi:diguanylate cyclase [Paenibacillus sp. CC-CFT747]|nr:diguanylate cyclase [Paenibacillus sp. CC-CFT747]